jgi:hypothetical protein
MSGHGPPSKTVATRRRAPGPLAGPRRDVVYIFEREGDHGGSYWLLVLECGHSATRPRVNPKDPLNALTHALFRPLAEKFAPKRVQCMYCGSGCEKDDPWVLIEALGGPARI